MSTDKTTPTGIDPGVLTDLDALTQEACTDIQALCKAALQALGPDPDALRQVRQLLLMIRGRAHDHEDRVNAAAEEHGAHWIDHEERAFADRMASAVQQVQAGKAGGAQ